MNSTILARVAGSLVLAVAVLAGLWAFNWTDSQLPADVPAYALDSASVLRAEWALAITVAAALPLILVGRLLTGRFPDKLSSQGPEWGSDPVESVDELKDNLDDIRTVLLQMLDVLEDHDQRLTKLGASDAG